MKSNADLRPITLLQNDYKILAKITGKRLARLEREYIKPMQRAFVPGRDIRPNVILTQALINQHKRSTDGAVLFIDFEKAYNQVDYDWLTKVFIKMGLGPVFTSMLELCLRGFQLRVRITSQAFENPFPRERGVGQGCPCAAGLFVLNVEPLLRRLNRTLRGLKTAEEPAPCAKVSACCDDVTAYMEGEQDVKETRASIGTWCEATSGSTNWNKCELIPLG